MIRHLRLASTLLLLVSTSALASPLIDGVKSRLTDAPLLRGQFEQQKSVKGFSRPLVSSGTFLVVKDGGVLWDTQKPFASTLTVTPRSLRAEHGDGAAAYQLDAAKEPALATVNALLLSLVSGDVAGLARHFKVEGALREAGAWKLTLVPTEPGLSRMFKAVRLEGDRHVRTVELDEVSGDASLIRFTALTEGPAPSGAEAARLAK